MVRAKENLRFRRLYSQPVGRSSGLICDQIIRLTIPKSAAAYPDKRRRIRCKNLETGKNVVVLTNDFTLPALTVAKLYRGRWQIELFFKWNKQHLRIKRLSGTSANAVRTQIWIAICSYVLVAIIRKRLDIERDLYTLLQILSVHLFEKAPLAQVLTESGYTFDDALPRNQLSLFDL